MNPGTAPIQAEDAAWASVNTPLSVDELKAFSRDIERLFRINPMLEFHDWERLADDRYCMAVKNTSQEQPFELQTELLVDEGEDCIVIYYSNGLKKKTVLQFEPSEHGSRLTIIAGFNGSMHIKRCFVIKIVFTPFHISYKSY